MPIWIDYLFNLTPGAPNLMFWRSLFVIIGLLLAAGIAGIILQRSEDKFTHRLGERLTLWGFTTAVVMLLLASFRFQNVYWFSMRFLLYFWAALMAVWIVIISWWWFMKVPHLRLKRQKNQEYNKYLPGIRH
ncbi:MAG: hypothetical protein V1846_03180 [Candidatus Komeilibacteria bacterium]